MSLVEAKSIPVLPIPNRKVCVRSIFGIDVDMEVPAFAERTQFVPDIDQQPSHSDLSKYQKYMPPSHSDLSKYQKYMPPSAHGCFGSEFKECLVDRN